MEKKILYIILFIALLTMNSCRKYNSFEKIVIKEYKQCNNSQNCIIDISNKMDFDWDTVCYISGGYSLDSINEFLGFELTEFTDIGDRLLFLKNNKVVCQYEWAIEADTHSGCVIFDEDISKRKISKTEAKFYANKIGSAYYLKLY